MQSGLLPDDVFRSRLEAVAASLSQWAVMHEDCAAIKILNVPGYWKMIAQPYTTGACPFELQLRADQRYDVAIGGELYEDLNIGSFVIFLGLADAISNGRVMRVHVASSLTGALQSVETQVSLQDGTVWAGAQTVVPDDQRCPLESEIREVRRYLPYRR